MATKPKRRRELDLDILRTLTRLATRAVRSGDRDMDDQIWQAATLVGLLGGLRFVYAPPPVRAKTKPERKAKRSEKQGRQKPPA